MTSLIAMRTRVKIQRNQINQNKKAPNSYREMTGLQSEKVHLGEGCHDQYQDKQEFKGQLTKEKAQGHEISEPGRVIIAITGMMSFKAKKAERDGTEMDQGNQPPRLLRCNPSSP